CSSSLAARPDGPLQGAHHCPDALRSPRGCGIRLQLKLESSLRPARPLLDRWAKPQFRSPEPEIDDWPRHVGIPPLVHADRRALGKPKELCNRVCVDEILGVHL